MKCIKMHGSNELKRIEDKKAYELVWNKKASYIPKCQYKAAHGKGPSATAATSEKKAKKQKKGTPTAQEAADDILSKNV